MPRPKALPYTLGKITYSAHPTSPGMVQARGYYRDSNNKRTEVTASGKTQAQATRELKHKVNERRGQHTGGDATLRHDTKLSAAAAIWLDWKSRQGLSASTMRDYRGYVKHSIDTGSLSNLTVSEANDVARIEAWLEGIADSRGQVAARQSKKVLSGILALAERRGAIPASVASRADTPKPKKDSTGDNKCADPDCDHDCGKRHLDTRRAFTVEEVSAVLAEAERSRADIGDLAHFLFGTGVRIKEALHCTAWEDVDLDAQTVRVRGTKTKQADRILGLSDDLTERLRARAGLHGTEGLVFGITRYESKLGQPRDRDNVSKSLRKVFAAAGVPWAGTHTFRRTVASWMDREGHSLADIADQLGHRDTNTTAGYLGRKGTAKRAASVMVLPRPAA